MECYWVLTCEHASNAVPPRFRSIFSKKSALLESHRGYDIGAQHYAQEISKSLSWPLFCGEYTRLLVDLNRSAHNPHLFSSITKTLDSTTKQEILDLYYTPFRTNVRQLVEKKIASGATVIHISCHTFTPILGRVERPMDLGILYDPHRADEKSLSLSLRQELAAHCSMCIRMNAPYKGVSDGHVTALRRLFSPDRYVGIELEINQSLYVSIKTELWQDAWLPRLVDSLRFLKKKRGVERYANRSATCK